MLQKHCQPLHYAAYNGETEAVQLLLDNKANINAKNKVNILVGNVTLNITLYAVMFLNC